MTKMSVQRRGLRLPGNRAFVWVFYPTKTRAIDGTVINNESSVPHLAKALRHNDAAIEHVDIWNYFNPITVIWDIRVLRLEPQPPDPEMEAVEAASIVRNDRAERFTRLSVAITTDWSAETRIAERRIHFVLNLPSDWFFSLQTGHWPCSSFKVQFVCKWALQTKRIK